MEEKPPTVPWEAGAKQGGEARARWAWTEPSVWTARMLTALETGVKGGAKNACFAEHGLSCLTTAHAQVVQSPLG